MKIAIIFHSVCGNTYIMAKSFYDNLKGKGQEVSLYRVFDEDFMNITKLFPVADEYAEEIVTIPVATAKVVLENDYILFGCPTYFGNVSGEMKSFMDSTMEFWTDAQLWGKKVSAFTSCGTPEGGGETCLEAISIYAQHMGMHYIPTPSNIIPSESFSAYGMIHYSGNNADMRPSARVENFIDKYTDLIINL